MCHLVMTINLLKATGQVVVANAFQSDTSVDTHKRDRNFFIVFYFIKHFSFTTMFKSQSGIEIIHLFQTSTDSKKASNNL